MFRLRVLAFAVCAFAAASATADEPKTGDEPATDKPGEKEKEKVTKIDPAKLPGSYKIVDGTKFGEKLTDDAKKASVTFTKDKITTKSPDATFAFSYKVDVTKTPAAVDMEILEPEGLKGSKAKGILKFVGTKLHLAYDSKGGPAPKEFKSVKDDNVLYFVLEMNKKGKGKDKKKDDDKEKDKDKE